MKILITAGTRAEAVKLAPVIKTLKKRRGTVCLVALTGQHEKPASDALAAFGIRPDLCPGQISAGGDLSRLLCRAIRRVSAAIGAVKPDLVLVHGDTVSALAGALAAFLRGVRVGHVEAGMRSFDLRSPYPEEGIRAMISRIAAYNFAPDPVCLENLVRERVPGRVYLTGSTVPDYLRGAVRRGYIFCTPELAFMNGSACRAVLVTAHRRENIGVGIENICKAVHSLAKKHPEVRFVFPIHPNPEVRTVVERELGGSGVVLLPPLGIVESVNLAARAFVIITDSGGLSEEGAALGVPVIVTRSATERVYLHMRGKLILAGTDPRAIVRAFERLAGDENVYRRMKSTPAPWMTRRSSICDVDVFSQSGK